MTRGERLLMVLTSEKSKVNTFSATSLQFCSPGSTTPFNVSQPGFPTVKIIFICLEIFCRVQILHGTLSKYARIFLSRVIQRTNQNYLSINTECFGYFDFFFVEKIKNIKLYVIICSSVYFNYKPLQNYIWSFVCSRNV